MPLRGYSYYLDTTIGREYAFGQVELRTTGTAGVVQLCRPVTGAIGTFPYVAYVNGVRSTGALASGGCANFTIGAGGDFQFYIRRSAIFGVHAGDSGGFSQNYNAFSLSQL